MCVYIYVYVYIYSECINIYVSIYIYTINIICYVYICYLLFTEGDTGFLFAIVLKSFPLK